jgi:hypothetical protein
MIEFAARILIDTQDAEIAFKEFNEALRFTGVRAVVSDRWLKNNDPIPADLTQRIAWNWTRNRTGLRFGNDIVQFHTNDPCFQTKLDNLRKAITSTVKGEGR